MKFVTYLAVLLIICFALFDSVRTEPKKNNKKNTKVKNNSKPTPKYRKGDNGKKKKNNSNKKNQKPKFRFEGPTTGRTNTDNKDVGVLSRRY